MNRHASCLVIYIMKTLGIVVLMFASSTAYAQQTTTVMPVAQTPPGPTLQVATDGAVTDRLDVELGAVRLMTHSGRYTFVYLPVLPPLQGTAFRPTLEMPNALALTGTTIPQKPHTRPSVLIRSR
jgi:hypothetical protein